MLRFVRRSPAHIRPATARLFATKKKAKFDIQKPEVYECDGPGADSVTESRGDLLAIYRDMMVTRRVETVSDTLYKQKLIRGFLHLANGQEAVSSGISSVMDPTDHFISAYRVHNWYLSRGGTPYQALCELMGRKDGCAGGRGGSMHFYDREHRFYGGNGIVGAQVPVGAGIAMAAKYLAPGKEVCIAAYGDGAANQGQVFEAYNLAALWQLPVIFLCENNLFAMGTSIDRGSADRRFYQRAHYIPGIQFDGMDVITVRHVAKWALDYCRIGNGPLVLEAMTYRYAGHSMSDPGTTYRSRDDVKKVREQSDPITMLHQRLVESELATDQELKQIAKDVKNEVAEAVERAKACEEPAISELHDATYVDPLNDPLSGCEVPAK